MRRTTGGLQTVLGKAACRKALYRIPGREKTRQFTGETPSSWGKNVAGNAIDLGTVPQQLQSSCTQTIIRAEFCALGVAIAEKLIGGEKYGLKAYERKQKECRPHGRHSR